MSACEPLPRNKTLSIMPTYRCTAACKSCGTLSSPRSKERLTLEHVLMAIRQAREAGIELVVFTGGEATLEAESLLAGLRLATGLGMATRLVTNCHWATSIEDSDRFVDALRMAGLGEINFSTGDQHARFVPVMQVLRAVRSALLHGFTPAVMIETTAANSITKSLLEENPFHQETVQKFPGRLIKFNESPWMPLNPNKKEVYPEGLAIDATNVWRAHGCDSVLETVTVQADGTIGACCGLGMRLIPELQVGVLGETTISEALVEAQEDLLKRWIRLEGPERILAWAATKDQTIEWEGRYAHRCQACLRLYRDPAVRTVIQEHHMEKIPDVLYGEFLLYEYEGGAVSSSASNDVSS